MNIKRSFGASVLFDRRPASATVALSLASLSALAALYQGITTHFFVQLQIYKVKIIT